MTHGVMVALLILVQSVKVRILMGQLTKMQSSYKSALCILFLGFRVQKVFASIKLGIRRRIVYDRIEAYRKN